MKTAAVRSNRLCANGFRELPNKYKLRLNKLRIIITWRKVNT